MNSAAQRYPDQADAGQDGRKRPGAMRVCPIGEGKAPTLKSMLEGKALNHSVILHHFCNSPLRDADMNVLVLGRILKKAYNEKTGLCGAFVDLDADMLAGHGAKTAEQWICAYANRKGKPHIPLLLKFDPENPRRVFLGEHLVRYLKETVPRHGVELG